MGKKPFKSIATPDRIPQVEEEIIAYWNTTRAFERSVTERDGRDRFVFYEGPPTANGKPGVHHVIARLCKDLVCRYKTMRGYQVIRKAGWDTHGLPVEIEVENELGFKHKDEIEDYGIANFNSRCRESVFKYEKDWEEFTQRIGYWLDLEHPYVTYTNEYIESVWWILKEFWKKDLLYEGHKIVPFCPRCETSLSSHEVSLGYRDTDDPSIFVKFGARGGKESFLVWTTTPWTLISNAALAVGPDFDYVRVEQKGEILILAEARLEALDGAYRLLEKFKGRALEGRKYEPLFPFFKGEKGAFAVFGGDFVSLEDGTGIVHIAPAFGEDDYKLHLKHGIPLLQPVSEQGTFTENIAPWAGRWIKDADPSIIKALEDGGKLYKSGKVTHAYPFCWRCDTPLIYYARRSWYVRTTAIKDQMIEANKRVNWIPEEVGKYRFGNWLENNVDWALSRERYWGTPLNIWICESCGKNHAVGSIEELREMGENVPPRDALDLHRPQVDGFTLRCPGCRSYMRRVSEVIDAWFDSGSMPFAQYHYPFDEEKMFEKQFPSDYICEGIDQSRGWFYSLLAISTFLKGESPYRNVVVTELILDKKGQKMSKSRGNVVEPWDVLDVEGADALRWYLIHNSPPWTPTRFDRKGVVESSQKLLGTLRNVYSFFAMYAAIDGYRFTGDRGTPNLLDRWLMSRFHSTAERVRDAMDAYAMTRAARLLQSFVLDELSNWYVRRSRRRFWKGEMGPDKVAAYHTLAAVLLGTLRLLAPFVPFVSEEIYQAFHGEFAPDEEGNHASVHLELYPEPDSSLVDPELESLMETALRVCGLGRTVRNDAGIRIRQPLAELVVYDASGRMGKVAEREAIRDLVVDELHVKKLSVAGDPLGIVSLKAVPNYPVLGRRFGNRVPELVSAIEKLSQKDLVLYLKGVDVTVKAGGEEVGLGREELAVAAVGKPPFGARTEHGLVVALNLEITEPLRLEGAAREIINRVQNLRKRAGYDVSDRIRVRYEGGALADRVFDRLGGLIRQETLAVSSERGGVDWKEATDVDLEGEQIRLWIRRESD